MSKKLNPVPPRGGSEKAYNLRTYLVEQKCKCLGFQLGIFAYGKRGYVDTKAAF